MRTDIFFFTDVDLLNDQTAEQAFGPVSGCEDTQYRITSMHTATANPCAYAVCDGHVYIQKSSKDQVSLILKPINDGIFQGIPILYFLYRNIRLDSYECPNVSNVLYDRINNGLGIDDIGLGLTTKENVPDILEMNIRNNSDDILSLFIKESSLMPPVKVHAGDVLGTFDSEKFGIEILLGSIFSEHTLQHVRTEDTIIEVSMQHTMQDRRRREEILNYMDPACFYGMQIANRIIIHKSDSSQETLETIDSIYSVVLKKFFNRNKVYIDIRDEKGFSYNYHRNSYTETLKCNFQSVSSPSDITPLMSIGVANPWPILILEKTNNSNIDKNIIIKMSFKTANPQGIRLYANNAYEYEKNYRILKKRKKLRPTQQKIIHIERCADTEWTEDAVFITPLVSCIENIEARTISSYYKFVFTDLEYGAGKNFDNVYSMRNLSKYIYLECRPSPCFWHTNHETFINNDIVVRAGISLDYNKERVIFYAVPINNSKNSGKSNKEIKSSGSNITNSLEKSFFQSYYRGDKFKEPQLVKVFRQISFNVGNGNVLELLTFAPSKQCGVDFYAISFMVSEYKEVIEPIISSYLENICSVFINISISKQEECKESFENDNFYSAELSLVGLKQDEFFLEPTKIENLLLYGFNDELLVTRTAGDKENISVSQDGMGIRGFVFRESQEGLYKKYNSSLSDCDIAKLRKTEKDDLKKGLSLIARYNRPFYDEIVQLILRGVKVVYPDESVKTFYPKIIIEYAEIGNVDFEENVFDSGQFLVKDYCDDIDENGNWKSNDRIILTESQVLDYINANQASHGKNVEWKYVRDKKQAYYLIESENDGNCYWTPTFKMTIPNTTTETIDNATIPIGKSYGRAVWKEDCSCYIKLNIISRLKKVKVNDSEKLNPYWMSDVLGDKLITDVYNKKMFFISSNLCHELGHFSYAVSNMLEFYLWHLLEKKIRCTPQYITHVYASQNDFGEKIIFDGHMLGNPFGTKAAKEELIFARNFFTQKKTLKKLRKHGYYAIKDALIGNIVYDEEIFNDWKNNFIKYEKYNLNILANEN